MMMTAAEIVKQLKPLGKEPRAKSRSPLKG